MNQITSDVVILSPQEIIDRWGGTLQIPIVVVRETAPAATRQTSRGPDHHQRGIQELMRVAGSDAEAIRTVIEHEGWRVTGSGQHPYSVAAILTATNIYRSLGPHVLARTLSLLGAVYNGDPGCTRKYVLRGVAEGLARTSPDVDVALGERMRAAYPTLDSLHADGGNFFAVVKDRVIRLAREL